MGRSRGGLATKIHALVDIKGRPICLKLTEGQAHDGRSAVDMFSTLEVGNILLADRAYDSDALREEMAARRLGEYPRHAKPRENLPFQPLGLPPAQRCRAIFQQTQTLPSSRNPIRQTR
jgi:hypothetical protein